MPTKKARSATIGGRDRPSRVRIAIFDGTGTKDVYAAKLTIYDLTPDEVIEPIRALITTIRDNKMRD